MTLELNRSSLAHGVIEFGVDFNFLSDMAHDLKLWPWFEAASDWDCNQKCWQQNRASVGHLGKTLSNQRWPYHENRRPNSFFGIPSNSSSGRIHWISTQDSFDATAAQLLLSPAPCWQAHRKLGMDLETCALETGYQYIDINLFYLRNSSQALILDFCQVMTDYVKIVLTVVTLFYIIVWLCYKNS